MAAVIFVMINTRKDLWRAKLLSAIQNPYRQWSKIDAMDVENMAIPVVKFI